MAKNPDVLRSPDDRPGQALAVELGWPRELMGFAGASSSLLDVGKRWRTLDSMVSVVQKRQEQRQQRIQLEALEMLREVLPAEQLPEVEDMIRRRERD